MASAADHKEEEAKVKEIADEFEAAHSTQKDVALEQLDADQKQSLQHMKEGVMNDLKQANNNYVPSERELLRFLKAESFNPEKGVEHYVKYMKWRSDQKIDNILNETVPQQALLDCVFPFKYSGFDKKGHPVYIEKTGRIAVKELTSVVKIENFLRFHAKGMEYVSTLMEQSSKRAGAPIDQVTVILDFEGLSLGHRNAIPLLQASTEFDFNYYPNRISSVFILNLPYFVPGLWQIVKVFLPESTKAALHILGADYKQVLAQYIDADQLPEEYGGTQPAMRLPTQDELNDLALRDSSGLKLTEHYVAAGSVFEHEVPVKPGDKLAWSFEVADAGYDIGFAVSLQPAAGAPVHLKHDSRVTTHKGEYVAAADGVAKFRWDNSFSYFNGKNIKYHGSVQQ